MLSAFNSFLFFIYFLSLREVSCLFDRAYSLKLNVFPFVCEIYASCVSLYVLRYPSLNSQQSYEVCLISVFMPSHHLPSFPLPFVMLPSCFVLLTSSPFNSSCLYILSSLSGSLSGNGVHFILFPSLILFFHLFSPFSPLLSSSQVALLFTYIPSLFFPLSSPSQSSPLVFLPFSF